MDLSVAANGYKDLAETMIREAINDLRPGQASHQDRYSACRFILDEKQMDIYTGLAPHMIRDWERAIPVARKILEKEKANGI